MTRYHVFCCSGTTATSLRRGEKEWVYLGSSDFSTFRASNIRLHCIGDVVTFAVSASDSLCQWDCDNAVTISIRP